MKVFISYHRADTKYKKKVENILNHYELDYYAVPEEKDFNGKSQQHIEAYILDKMKSCDIILCLIGANTYTRPHVDREIHNALKGDNSTRKGIVGVFLPTRQDDLNNMELSTVPMKLRENRKYVVWANWVELNVEINNLLAKALSNARNRKLKTSHKNPCMELRATKYYDN